MNEKLGRLGCCCRISGSIRFLPFCWNIFWERWSPLFCPTNIVLDALLFFCIELNWLVKDTSFFNWGTTTTTIYVLMLFDLISFTLVANYLIEHSSSIWAWDLKLNDWISGFYWRCTWHDYDDLVIWEEEK